MRKGFTLLELLMTLSVLMLLAGIVYSDKSLTNMEERSALKTLMNSAVITEELYNQKNGHYYIGYIYRNNYSFYGASDSKFSFPSSKRKEWITIIVDPLNSDEYILNISEANKKLSLTFHSADLDKNPLLSAEELSIIEVIE